MEDASAEGIGSVGKFEEGEGHEFDGEELVIGKEVEEEGTLFFVFELLWAGEGTGGFFSNRNEGVRPAGKIGCAIASPLGWV